MKTKTYILGGIILAIFAISLVTGIVIGERQTAELQMKERVELALERAAEYTGYESLGVVDGYAVSKRNGCIYDGPAIKQALFEQNGLETPKNTLDFWFGETDDGVMLYKMVVYSDEAKEPLIREKVEKVYLYGQI